MFAVTLMLAVVIPTLGGLRVAGMGGPIDLPDDPQVGDCVLESLSTILANSTVTSAPTFAPSFVPCDGRSVGGEVVVVARATGSVRDRIVQAEATGTDCYHASLQYSGLAPFGGRYVLAEHSAHDVVAWNLTINVRTAWVVPAPLYRTLGQDWVACVAAPLSGTAFRGQLAAAFTGGKLPDEFGFCWEQGTPSAKGAASCAGRHVAELVSLGTIPAGTPVALTDIESSCKRLSAQVVGRSDPTAAGRLEVGTAVTPDGPESLPAFHVICYIEPATGALTGSLVGLRDRPIPYAR